MRALPRVSPGSALRHLVAEVADQLGRVLCGGSHLGRPGDEVVPLLVGARTLAIGELGGGVGAEGEGLVRLEDEALVERAPRVDVCHEADPAVLLVLDLVEGGERPRVAGDA
jgi:hypothetical protein